MFNFFNKEKVKNTFIIFSAKEDITTFELAKCMNIIITHGILKYPTGENPLKEYDDSVKRHFKIEKK